MFYAPINRVVLGLYGGATLNWLSHMSCSHSQNKQLTTLHDLSQPSAESTVLMQLNQVTFIPVNRKYIQVSCFITGQLLQSVAYITYNVWPTTGSSKKMEVHQYLGKDVGQFPLTGAYCQNISTVPEG